MTTGSEHGGGTFQESPALRLTGLLVETGAVSGPPRMRAVIRELEGMLTYHVPINVEGTERFDALALAQFCLAEPSERLPVLGELIAQLVGQTNVVEKLASTIRELLDESAVGLKNLEELKELLQGVKVTEQVIERCYWESVGGLGLSLPSTQLSEVLDLLNNLARREGDDEFPIQLIAFTERLALHLGAGDPGIRVELQEWANNVIWSVRRLGIKKMTLDGFRHQLAEAPDEQRAASPYLLIAFRPRGIDQDLDPLDKPYDVTAWLMLDKTVVADFRGEATATVNDAEKHVNDWIVKIHRRLPQAISPLMIEVFAPLSLLPFAVDRWDNMVQAGTKIGQQYRIVVRGLDRRDFPTSWWYWETKWKLLKRHPTDAAEPIRWVESADAVEPGQLWLELIDERRHVISLGLHFSPADRHPAADLLEVALKAGVPMVVWTRAGGMEQFREAVTEKLSSTGFDDLPGLVLYQRTDAHLQPADRRDEHVGSHLALLWDDPDRWLPDDPLREPRTTEEAPR